MSHRHLAAVVSRRSQSLRSDRAGAIEADRTRSQRR